MTPMLVLVLRWFLCSYSSRWYGCVAFVLGPSEFLTCSDHVGWSAAPAKSGGVKGAAWDHKPQARNVQQIQPTSTVKDRSLCSRLSLARLG